MRIAEVAPLYESVSPKYYGGTERVVSYLTEELVRQGHEVTLFASGDSETKARLVAACRSSLRLNKHCQNQLAHHFVMLERLSERAADFDIIHFHIDYLHFALSRREQITQATTLHGRLDIPDLVPLYQEFQDMPVISISNAQREPLPWANWQATDRVDQDYFDSVVAPLLRDSLVEFVGEIGDGEKDEFLGNAHALLFPIDWPEPFGLVMIEAMACGTPVVAYRDGAVPELLEPGQTGFIVENLEDAVEAVRGVAQLSRRRCRETFEQRFTATRMAHDYVRQFERLIARDEEVSEAA